MILNSNFERSTENKETLNFELTKLKNDLISYNLAILKNYFSGKQTEIFLDSIKTSISNKLILFTNKTILVLVN